MLYAKAEHTNLHYLKLNAIQFQVAWNSTIFMKCAQFNEEDTANAIKGKMSINTNFKHFFVSYKGVNADNFLKNTQR